MTNSSPFDLFSQTERDRRKKKKKNPDLYSVLMFFSGWSYFGPHSRVRWSADADRHTYAWLLMCYTLHACIHPQAARALLPPAWSMLTLIYGSRDPCFESTCHEKESHSLVLVVEGYTRIKYTRSVVFADNPKANALWINWRVVFFFFLWRRVRFYYGFLLGLLHGSQSMLWTSWWVGSIYSPETVHTLHC